MRVRNWDLAVIEWATGLRGVPFVWGRTDCGTLVREMTILIYDRDIFAGIRRWKSARGMESAVEKAGGVSSIFDAVGAEVGVRFARTGDVMVRPRGCPLTGLDSVMPVADGHVVVATPGEPLQLVPLRQLAVEVRIWRLDA